MKVSKWPERRLIECGQMLSGGTPSKSEAHYWQGSIPWYSSKELKAFELSDSELHVSPEAAAKGSTLVPPGTVLFVIRGMSLANEFRVSRTLVEATFNQDVKAIVPEPGIESRYLARCLRWLEPRVLKQAEVSSHGTKRLPSQVFENLPIPIPPLTEQRRIADILDKADTIRRKRKEAIALTEELLRSTFLEMFGDPVTNPKGWPVKRLGDVVDCIDYGVTASANPKQVGPKFLRITDIQDNQVDWATVPFCECDDATARRALLRSGDIVFARTGATTGKSYWIRECPQNAVFASYLIRVRPGQSLLPGYLSEFFQSPGYWNQIRGMAEGAAQPGVNASKLATLVLPVPSLSAQQRMADFAEKVFSLQPELRAAIQTSDQLFDSLVARAFAGELESPR